MLLKLCKYIGFQFLELIHRQGTEGLLTVQTKRECIKFDNLGITFLFVLYSRKSRASVLSLEMRQKENNYII